MSVSIYSPEAKALAALCEAAIAKGYRAGAAGLSSPGPGFDASETAELLVRDIHKHLDLSWPVLVPWEPQS